MSDTDRLREALDLTEASGLDLVEFASHCGLKLERLEQWRRHLKNASSVPKHLRVKRLLLLLEELATEGDAKVVVRLVLDGGSWIEVPVGFSSEHLVALLAVLREC